MKKTISLIALLLIFMSATMVQAATFTEIEKKDSRYQFVSWLCDEKNEIDIAQEAAVTREQFIKLVFDVFKIDIYESKSTRFSDVKAELKPILEKSVGANLISDGDYFRPEEAITLPECLKILITAAKSDAEIPYYGGYPEGYYKVSNELDITKGIALSKEGTLLPEQAYALVYNMLLAPRLEVNSSGQNYNYEYSSTETNLSCIWGIHYAEGIMNGNEYGNFGTKNPDEIEGVLQVDGVSYEVSEDYNNLLGYNVSVYYSKNYGFKKAEYITALKNGTVEILTSDEPVYRDGIIEYVDENNRTKKLKIDSSCDYIYNGKPHYGMTSNQIIPEIGTINLIDNNDDGKYDVIDISSYYYMIVDNVDLYNEIIYAVNSPDKKIDFSDNSTVKIYSKSEQQYVSPAAIEAGAALAVEASYDEKLYSIIILDEAVSGKITSYSEEILELDGVQYELSAYFKNEIGNLSNISLGTESSVTIGLFNDVVAVESGSDIMKYAYCINAWEHENREDFSLKMYIEDGKLIKSELADKVSVDGNSFESKRDVYNRIGGNSISPQVVRVMFNEDNKIIRIDLAEATTDIKDCLDDQVKNPYNNLIKYDITLNPCQYRHGVVYPYFYVNGSKVMCIPTSDDLNNELGYNMGYSWVNDQFYPGFTAYNVDSSGKPDFILLQGANKDLEAQETQAMIVEKIMTGINPDDEVGVFVSGWNDGNYVELFIAENTNIERLDENRSELEPGDVFRYTLDTNGYIDQIMIDFCAYDNAGNVYLGKNDAGKTNATFNNGTGKVHYELGNVYSKASTNMFLYDEANNKYINVVPPKNFIEFNLTTKTMRPISYSEILSHMNVGDDSDFVLVRQHYRYSQTGFIYTR